MNHEFLRMQKLSGVITEGEYNQKIEELNSTESSTETLNENVVGIGSVLNPYPTKAKEVYESAFNEFLTEEKEEMEEGVHSDEKEMEEGMHSDKEEMEEAHCYEEPVKEMGMKYEEPVEETKEDLDEDARTDAEEEGYQDGFKDALKDAKDAIAKLRKELKEIDLTEEETKKEKEEGDMRDDGGESVETKRTERMKDMGRD